MIEKASAHDRGHIPQRIVKPEVSAHMRPNLGDYDAVRAAFSWEREHERLAGLPTGGLNIAHEAVDRHLGSARAERTAIRWIDKGGARREFSYLALAAATSRFASALRSLGVQPGERVFVLMGRVPELYVAVLGALKAGCVVVAVVETHKGAIDVECFLDGVIDDLARLGEDLPVGALLARVRGVDEAAAPAAQARAAAPTSASPPATAAERIAATSSAAPLRVKLSPAARRRAQQLGLDAQTLQGSGADGAVTLADVERAASAPQPLAAARRGFDPAQMRRAIAAAMARSKSEIPHYYLTSTIDFAAASAWLAAYNRERDPTERLLPATLLLKATAKALTEVPQFNGFLENGAFRAGSGNHVGWAIALRGGGLVAPAIRDAPTASRCLI